MGVGCRSDNSAAPRRPFRHSSATVPRTARAPGGPRIKTTRTGVSWGGGFAHSISTTADSPSGLLSSIGGRRRPLCAHRRAPWVALHGRMGTFEASQDSQPRVRFGVRWGEGGGTGLLKWASPPHVDFAFPPASLPRPRTTQPWFFHLLPTKTLSRDSSIHVEGGKGGETNPFDLRWGSGAERESPYHRNKVGFSKSALPLRRKDLPRQVVILRAQECSLSWR